MRHQSRRRAFAYNLRPVCSVCDSDVHWGCSIFASVLATLHDLNKCSNTVTRCVYTLYMFNTDYSLQSDVDHAADEALPVNVMPDGCAIRQV